MTDCDKAREIADEIDRRCCLGRASECEFSEVLAAEIIAAALREAENAAYEKAAQVAQECRQGPLLVDKNGDVVGSYAGNWCAAVIRALKDKGE